MICCAFMKKLIFLSFFILISCSYPDFDENFSIRECNEIASEINATMSDMSVDAITILKNAVCHRPAKLNYMYEMKIIISRDKFDIQSLKSKNLQTVCTDPNMRFLLDRLSGVGYTYRDKNGSYIGEYEIHKSECR